MSSSKFKRRKNQRKIRRNKIRQKGMWSILYSVVDNALRNYGM